MDFKKGLAGLIVGVVIIALFGFIYVVTHVRYPSIAALSLVGVFAGLGVAFWIPVYYWGRMFFGTDRSGDAKA